MGKNKLQKFADMEVFPHVFQLSSNELRQGALFHLKGKWNSFFGNENPIVLELGCGKGEYAVSLAKLYPEKNFIGIDIKGARMWTGAKQSHEEKLPNVAFLRTNIEMIDHFFGAGEIAEIWITFPDPQMKKINKRMTSTRFMGVYQKIMKENGIIHLKTDSNFMFTYTCEMIRVNNFNVLFCNDDLYHSDLNNPILSIQTFYEQQWINRGLTIKYIKFELPTNKNLIELDVEIELDSYRSFNRSKRSEIEKKK